MALSSQEKSARSYARDPTRGRAKSARWRARHPEKAKEATRRWYAVNKQRVQAEHRAWCKANREKIREADRRYYWANVELERQRSRKEGLRWRKANPERVRELARRWRVRNPEQRAANRAKRRARTKVDSLTVFERAQMLAVYAIARARTVQTGVQHHVDHVVPLARGGRHHPSNLQVLTATENIRKGARGTMKLSGMETSG